MRISFVSTFCKNIKKDGDKSIMRLYFSNFAINKTKLDV